MSFKLGDLIIKEILYGYAESLSADATPLYVLTQLSDASIEITAESNDVTDKNGNLVKKVWLSKSGSFNATNAFVNANIIQAASGSEAEFASAEGKINMPKIVKVKAGETATLTGVVTGTVKVNQFYNDGSMGKAYTQAEAASTTEFAITSEGVLTVPTDADADAFIVRYTKAIEEGAVIRNNAEDFPSSVRLILVATYYDPCEKDAVREIIIELPSFQVSPETTVSLSSSDTKMDFKGDLEISYCDTERTLYNIYIPGDDE